MRRAAHGARPKFRASPRRRGGGAGETMANTVIIGAQWGDEGKGKIVDMLSAQSQVVVRFQGGANAGQSGTEYTDADYNEVDDN